MSFARPRTRSVLVAGPLALTLAVPGAWVVLRPHGPDLPRFDAWTQDAGHTDGLDRYVVTLADTGAGSGADTAATGAPATDPAAFTAAVERMTAAGGHPRVELSADGRTVVVDTAGVVPPVPVGSTAATHPATRAQGQRRPDDPQLLALGHAAGVRHVVPLRDGSVLVAVAPGTDVSALPGVATAHRDATATFTTLAAMPDDRYAAMDWPLHNDGASISGAIAGDDVGALDAWGRTRGHGVVIADVDSGYDTSHPDLQTGLWTNPRESCNATTDTDGDGLVGDCHGWNFYLNSPDLRNVVGGSPASAHGTETAGTMVATAGNGQGGAGLAPAATVMPLVVGAGSTVNVALATQAIYYAVDHGASVINCSWGGPSDVPALDAAIDYAGAHGVLVVVSAGNDSGNRDVTPIYPADTRRPNVISVGASTPSDTIASFSAYGPNTVDLFAPGTSVLVPTVGGGYGLAAGTSFSAPLVSATAALVKSLDPALTATDLRQRILSTVTPRTAFAGASITGGRLSAAGAVATVAQPVAFRYGGLAGLSTGQPAHVSIATSGSGAGLPAGPLSVKVSVAARYAGRVYAVRGLTVDAGAAGTATTGSDGSVLLSPPGLDAAHLASTLDLSLTLPGGDFALVSQLYVGSTPVSRPSAATFTVAGAVAAPPVTGGGSAPPSGGSGSTPPSGGTGSRPPAGGSTTPPGSGPAPGAPAPGGSVARPPATGGSSTPPTRSGGGSAPAPAGSAPAPGGSAPAPSTPHVPQPPATRGATTPPSGGSAPVPGGPVSRPPASGSTPPSSGGSAPAPSAPRVPQPPASGGGATPPTGSTPAPDRTLAPSTHFGITRISPGSGSTAGYQPVTIYGSRLPMPVYVLFDHQAVPALVATPGQVMVLTPPHVAGPAEIEVFAQDGTEDVLAGAFTYVAPASSGGGSAPGGSGGSTPGGSGGGSTPPSSGVTPPSGGGGSAPSTPGGATTPGSPGGSGSGGAGSGGPGSGGSGSGGSGSGGTSPGGTAPQPGGWGGLQLVDTGGVVGGVDLSAWAMPACGAGCDGIEVG